MATLLGADSEVGAAVEGSAEALDSLRAMLALPEAHREDAMTELAAAST